MSPLFASLTIMLDSNNVISKIASLRLLNSLSSSYPNEIAETMEHDIESLVNDSNVSISTLSSALLLQIANEHTLDKYLKFVANSMTNNYKKGDEAAKKYVIISLKSLIIKFPSKSGALLA